MRWLRLVCATHRTTQTRPMLASARMMGWPFVIGGGVKIIYDLLLYCSFSKLKKEQ